MKIRNIKDLDSMLCYFGENLNWSIDTDDFEVSDYTYEVYSDDLGIKEEEFAKISSLYQMRPLTDNMPFGVFAVTFESKRLEVAALKKILSRLITKKKDNPDYPTWNLHDLIFLCFWGEDSNSFIGVACFDDNDKKLPQLKIEYIQPSNEEKSQIDIFESKIAHLAMPGDTSDIENWRKEWGKAFSAVYHQQITDSQNLAKALAGMAQHTRDTIIETYNVETGLGYVHLLYRKFKESLVHDLDVTQFADMYAQTIAYGLFSAKCMDNSDEFNWQNAIDKIPNTNPFLKTLIRSCFERDKNSKSFFDELELAEIIKLLDNTNIKNILDNFNRRTGGGREDTVIYFYEDFLSAYEHETKKRRGVYYTPWPVVKFMVRAVDDILRTEFGFADGLADTAMQTITYKRDSKKKNSQGMITQVDDTMEVPAIQILDPATGTGTFLREVILNIHDTFVEKHKGKSDEEIKKLWNEYVPEHLLKRINGFELMMAPYAVAHMKLAMVLKETGYDFESDQRLNVMLTNSLEPPASDVDFSNNVQQLSFFSDPLAAEAYEADKAKNNRGINVIIGNPPYSGESSNKGEWIMSLMEDYKKEPASTEQLRERNPKNINADENKFIRLAQYNISVNGKGVIAFITPHGYTFNKTFRGMRWNIIDFFDKIYVLDLNGNARQKMFGTNTEYDENVFDIMQGVAITLMIKNGNKKTELADVLHYSIKGMREDKYRFLSDNNISSINWNKVCPVTPYYLLSDNINVDSDYESGINLRDLFEVNSVGIVSGNDSELVQYTMIDNNYSKYSYRPFDTRYIVYDNNVLQRARNTVMKHVCHDNYSLCIGGVAKNDYPQCLITKDYICKQYVTSETYAMPIYTYTKSLGQISCVSNLRSEIVIDISEKLNLLFNDSNGNKKHETFSSINFLDYIYAVLYSPNYRESNKEALKLDFPRIPYPTEIDIFWKMVNLGEELRQLHLMESPLLDTLITHFPLNGSNEVEKITRKENRVYINKTQYFEGVSDLAWNFYIGGYQPLQKWLKDRKGRILSDEDIIHYQKIVVALTETDRLMKEIDEVFVFGEEVTVND